MGLSFPRCVLSASQGNADKDVTLGWYLSLHANETRTNGKGKAVTVKKPILEDVCESTLIHQSYSMLGGAGARGGQSCGVGSGRGGRGG